MGHHLRILNETNGYRLKRGRAEREIKDCTATWVIPGVSIRNLTRAEMLQAMLDRPDQDDYQNWDGPLRRAELLGVRYQPSPTGALTTKLEGRLVRAAKQFALGHAGF